MQIKQEHPFKTVSGRLINRLIKIYAEDDKGTKGKIIRDQTKEVFDYVIDIYPSKYTYSVAGQKITKAIKDDADEKAEVLLEEDEKSSKGKTENKNIFEKLFKREEE